MRGTSVYPVKADDLADFGLTDQQLANRIERVGPKPVSDSINIDSAGNIYITDLPAKAIGVLSPAPDGGEVTSPRATTCSNGLTASATAPTASTTSTSTNLTPASTPATHPTAPSNSNPLPPARWVADLKSDLKPPDFRHVLEATTALSQVAERRERHV